jgi:hypothetical protein
MKLKYMIDRIFVSFKQMANSGLFRIDIVLSVIFYSFLSEMCWNASSQVSKFGHTKLETTCQLRNLS